MMGQQLDWLTMRVMATPNKTALIIGDHQFSYTELDRMVGYLGNLLVEEGVESGNHVATLIGNCLAAVCTLFAVARLGAVLVPLNIRLSATGLKRQLHDADVQILLHTDGLRTVAAGAGGQLPRVELPANNDEFVDHLRLYSGNQSTRSHSDYWDLEEIQAIVFTSGTTGRAKGAMLTLGNHYHSAIASTFRLGTMPEDRWLICMPLYHVGGMAILLRACLYGITVILQTTFDEETVSDSLANQQVSIVSLVPTMLIRLLDQRGVMSRPQLRIILLGGSAASPNLLSQAASLGLPIAPTYGLTEAASQVATMHPEKALLKPGSAGRPLAFTQVEIQSNEGERLPPDSVGEVVVSGPTVTAGYYNDPVATAVTLRDGHLFTGDMGYLDEDGDLWLVARRNDLIISGGENVYPVEVEQVLLTHPALEAVCVTGIDDLEWGQRVAATVVTRPNVEVTAAELDIFLTEHVAGFKRPRTYRFVNELPLTGSGKIHRQQVTTDMITETALER